MRLNFAGVPDENIREGIRRISAIARPDTGLMGALTGSSAGTTPGGTADADSGTSGETSCTETDSRAQTTERDPGLADVVELPRRPEQDSPSRRRQDR
jgi:hypothetical protein